MTDLKQILVPTDFSDNAGLALQYAGSLAEHYGARIHLLHVIPDPTTAMGIYEQISDAIPPDWLDTMQHHSNNQLDETVRKECGDVDNVIKTTAQGDTFTEITRYARDNAVDLIIIGTHGRTATPHHMLGSLADKVFRKAPCPVMTVPAGDHEFSMP